MNSSQVRLASAPWHLILVEPCISGLHGHWVEYAVALAGEARRHGIPVSIWVSSDLAVDVAQALEAAGLEVVYAFTSRMQLNLRMRLLHWLDETWRFHSGLTKTKYAAEARKPLFCVLGGRPSFLAATSWSYLQGTLQHPTVMQFFDWDESPVRDGKLLMASAYELVIALARRAMQSRRLVIAGQTATVADELTEVFDEAIPALPMIIDWNSFPSYPRDRQIPNAGFIGAMIARRGINQAVKAVHQVRAPLRWVFSVSQVPFANAGSPEETFSGIDPQVSYHVHLGPFDRDEYKQRLAELDIVMLPYDPQIYRNKTSGVFAEAVGLEKVVVVPEGTWMAQLVAAHDIGVVYQDYTSEGLARGLERAAGGLHHYQRNLEEFALRWRHRHCVEAFLRRLLELAEC
jgi:hypothetical protein